MSKVESESVIGVSGAGEALLPWESLTDYRALRDAFWRDHGPRGATEQALVARLVWIEWRRRRLALAERAAHMAALAERIGAAARTLERAGVRDSAVRERLDLKEIVESDASGDATKAKRHATDCEATARALALLKRNGADAYARAVAALHEDTRAWWDDGLAGDYGDERNWTPTAECLAAFLREDVEPADKAVAASNAVRPAVRLQAFGESLDPDRIERLMAIDARLDRQFEKALSMLIQLQQMRAAGQQPPRRERLRAVACG